MKNFIEWQDEERKKRENNNLSLEKFFGRKKELAHLNEFVENRIQKVFFLYGIPMIGKSTLVREFCRSIPDYKHITIKFINPESPEITLERFFPEIDMSGNKKQFVTIENFEEALLWKGNIEHLHEIRFQKVIQFIKNIAMLPLTKLLIESRFRIKNDFLHSSVTTELPENQLGKMDRNELFVSLNEIYRSNTASFESFNLLCEKLNDHIWLIELAMQDTWFYEDILEATYHPEIITQKLWEKVRTIINRFSSQHKVLLCAFGVKNPLDEKVIKEDLAVLPVFTKKEEVDNTLISLRKKLFLIYNAKKQQYEINPFLREICFTHLKTQKEMRVIEQIPYFKELEKPVYNAAIQAYEQNNFKMFFDDIKKLKKKRKYEEAREILMCVLEDGAAPVKPSILNEIGITYKFQHNYSKAIEYLEKARELGNNYSYIELALVHKDLKNYHEAESVIEKLMELEPKNIVAINILAFIYKDQKKINLAIETLEKACLIDPTSIYTYNKLALIYKEQNNFEKAIEVQKKTIEIDAKGIHSYIELAILYRLDKNYEKAIETLEKAMEIDENIQCYRELVTVYKEQNNFEKAIEVQEKIIQLNKPSTKNVLETGKKNYIEELIMKSNLFDAIIELKSALKKANIDDKEIILIGFRFSKIKQDSDRGIITHQQETTELTKLSKDLLSFMEIV